MNMNKKNLFIDDLRMTIMGYTSMYFDNCEISCMLDEMLTSGFYLSYNDIFEKSSEQVLVDLINYGMIENTDSTLLRKLHGKMR